MRVDDKVAIVTGSSRGIGEAIARRLATGGAKVVLASRKIDGIEAAAERIRSAGGEAHAIACHCGDPEQIEALVGKSVEHFGKVDVLVNNAATNPFFGPMLNIEWAAWDKTFDVNVKGYFAATRAVVNHFDSRQAKGSVINVASILGSQAASMQGVYGMTKAAVISMTKTLAMELGGRGIRVNAIAPGFVDTKFSSMLVANPDINKMIVDRTPLDRIGAPEDIAAAALYLASDESAFVTGSVMTIDGGLTIG